MRDGLNYALINTIETLLLQNKKGVSEYELITALQNQQGDALGTLNGLSLQDTYELFQIHFMVFHCLYQIKDRWLSEEKYCLNIDPIKITLLPYVKSLSEEIVTADPLRSYYLDLANFETTDAEAAEDLIASFWKKFVVADDRQAALLVFGLEDGVDFERIKQQYRQLAMDHHPDRGGDSLKLAEINQAMRVLKNYYR